MVRRRIFLNGREQFTSGYVPAALGVEEFALALAELLGVVGLLALALAFAGFAPEAQGRSEWPLQSRQGDQHGSIGSTYESDSIVRIEEQASRSVTEAAACLRF